MDTLQHPDTPIYPQLSILRQRLYDYPTAATYCAELSGTKQISQDKPEDHRFVTIPNGLCIGFYQ